MTEIITENPIDEEKLKHAIHETGYEVLSIKNGTLCKKGLFKK